MARFSDKDKPGKPHRRPQDDDSGAGFDQNRPGPDVDLGLQTPGALTPGPGEFATPTTDAPDDESFLAAFERNVEKRFSDRPADAAPQEDDIPSALPASSIDSFALDAAHPSKADTVLKGFKEPSEANTLHLDAEDPILKLVPGGVINKRFEILKPLGHGGMGAVYLVNDRHLNEKKALKVMLPSLLESAEAQRRFLIEIKVSQKLSHEGIVRVHDYSFDYDTGLQFFTMAFVQGQTLSEYVKVHGGKLSLLEALDVMEHLCHALTYAHQKTIHRDLKPQNIMRGQDGHITILDFGLAKLMDPNKLVQSNISLGTVHYQSPEQKFEPQSVDHRTDIYALGVILYQLLVGEVPAGAFRPASRRSPGLPRKVDRIIEKCLRAKEERYDSAAALWHDLEKLKGWHFPSPLDVWENAVDLARAAVQPIRRRLPAPHVAARIGLATAVVAMFVIGGALAVPRMHQAWQARQEAAATTAAASMEQRYTEMRDYLTAFAPDILPTVDATRQTGDSHFAAGAFGNARDAYESALQLLDTHGAEARTQFAALQEAARLARDSYQAADEALSEDLPPEWVQPVGDARAQATEQYNTLDSLDTLPNLTEKKAALENAVATLPGATRTLLEGRARMLAGRVADGWIGLPPHGEQYFPEEYAALDGRIQALDAQLAEEAFATAVEEAIDIRGAVEKFDTALATEIAARTNAANAANTALQAQANAFAALPPWLQERIDGRDSAAASAAQAQDAFENQRYWEADARLQAAQADYDTLLASAKNVLTQEEARLQEFTAKLSAPLPALPDNPESGLPALRDQAIATQESARLMADTPLQLPARIAAFAKAVEARSAYVGQLDGFNTMQEAQDEVQTLLASLDSRRDGLNLAYVEQFAGAPLGRALTERETGVAHLKAQRFDEAKVALGQASESLNEAIAEADRGAAAAYDTRLKALTDRYGDFLVADTPANDTTTAGAKARLEEAAQAASEKAYATALAQLDGAELQLAKAVEARRMTALEGARLAAEAGQEAKNPYVDTFAAAAWEAAMAHYDTATSTPDPAIAENHYKDATRGFEGANRNALDRAYADRQAKLQGLLTDANAGLFEYFDQADTWQKFAATAAETPDEITETGIADLVVATSALAQQMKALNGQLDGELQTARKNIADLDGAIDNVARTKKTAPASIPGYGDIATAQEAADTLDDKVAVLAAYGAVEEKLRAVRAALEALPTPAPEPAPEVPMPEEEVMEVPAPPATPTVDWDARYQTAKATVDKTIAQLAPFVGDYAATALQAAQEKYAAARTANGEAGVEAMNAAEKLYEKATDTAQSNLKTAIEKQLATTAGALAGLPDDANDLIGNAITQVVENQNGASASLQAGKWLEAKKLADDSAALADGLAAQYDMAKLAREVDAAAQTAAQARLAKLGANDTGSAAYDTDAVGAALQVLNDANTARAAGNLAAAKSAYLEATQRLSNLPEAPPPAEPKTDGPTGDPRKKFRAPAQR